MRKRHYHIWCKTGVALWLESRLTPFKFHPMGLLTTALSILSHDWGFYLLSITFKWDEWNPISVGSSRQFHYTRSVFPFFAFAMISLSARYASCSVCHNSRRFFWVAFICHIWAAVPSFKTLLHFHWLYHFTWHYLSSLSGADRHKSIVIYL